MLVAHVSDCYLPRTGGIESQVSDLAARQAATGHEVHVLTATLGPGGERGGVVDVERGVHVHRLGARMPSDLPVNPAQARLIATALRAVRPDVVHVHAGMLSPFAFDGARAALAQRLPVAVTWHCMLDGAVTALRTGARLTGWARQPLALSAVSEIAADRVEAVFGRPVAVVPNGLDLDRWVPDAATGSGTDPRPAGSRPLRLVSTMRLAPRKRAVPLVDAVAAAAARLAPGALTLDLVGSGPDRRKVERRVERHGLGGVVRVRGRLPREDLRAIYSRADVFLAPAVLEAFGIAALEARVAGLAVVARRQTGIATFVEHGTNGLLVDDDEGLADAVVQLARDRALLGRIRLRNAGNLPDLGWEQVMVAAQREYERARELRDGRGGEIAENA
ncbi:glycosyltransferase family 4 protein [Cellulomonas fimi]|uniref:D-inositol 3-phosphate glycosyltransferase n=1 Tax=Cellulomonas fimi TaxID=1708 RepID=A0A7Y0QGC8_CELFI|nr:glycosyltransferase family 4 protein [Cellulomonas fimi]NMR18963.1 glycosyltransferase family 4 protein [Cellulomonas fimi]